MKKNGHSEIRNKQKYRNRDTEVHTNHTEYINTEIQTKNKEIQKYVYS